MYARSVLAILVENISRCRMSINISPAVELERFGNRQFIFDVENTAHIY